MNRFFVNDIGPEGAVIAGEDLKHLSSVLRLKKGDHVMLSDGRGSECEGVAPEIEALLVEFFTTETSDNELPFLPANW